jgi:SEC-C motif
MLPFDVLFPLVAQQESRAITVSDRPPLTQGTFLFRENYCTDRGCDCRRVLVQVYWSERKEQVATISYAFEPPKPPHEDEGQVFLDPINPQSELSAALLAIFKDMVEADAEFRDRLIRHYQMWKRVVDDPSHPDQAVLRSIPSYDPGGRRGAPAAPKVGLYELCPCGSGRKFKWCCRT